MTPEQVPYLKGYQALRAQRRAELAKLQRQVAERKPAARLILGFFFGIFGVVMMGVPPLAGVFIVVAFISFSSGLKQIGVRRKVKAVMNEENAKWNIRDRTIEKLGDDGFETLAKSLEANGSYESLSGWLSRKDMDEAEVNTLILAAASAGEERARMQISEDMKARAGFGRGDAQERAARQYDAAFGSEQKSESFVTRDADAPETSSEEGLHAKLLAEESADAAMPPKQRRDKNDPELDDIRQRVADAQRRRRSRE